MDLSAEHRGRRNALRRAVIGRAGDALLLVCRDSVGWQDICYYTGFIGTAGAFIMTAREDTLILDSRYCGDAPTDSSLHTVSCADLGAHSPLEAALSLISRSGHKRVAYGGVSFIHNVHRSMAAHLGDGVELTDASRVLFAARRRKSANEIANIRRAIDIAGRAFEEALAEARPGMTERAFASTLVGRLLAGGSDFFDQVPVMTASGPRASTPHSFPTNKKIARGELVVVDFSARVSGYVCDITRAFCFGPPQQEVSAFYSLAQWAQADAAALLAPGVAVRDVDAAARSVFTSAGIARAFIHGLGHGIGLAVHEPPSIGEASDDLLAEGDVITIEPGLYRAGEFGVRIEDDYVITQSGAACLTENLNRELRIV